MKKPDHAAAVHLAPGSLLLGNTKSGAGGPNPLGIAMLHAEDILKGEAMISGPSCPLRLGVLDSPDYWTDDALMSAVRPLNPEELHHLAVGSQQRRNQQRGVRTTRSFNSGG